MNSLSLSSSSSSGSYSNDSQASSVISSNGWQRISPSQSAKIHGKLLGEHSQSAEIHGKVLEERVSWVFRYENLRKKIASNTKLPPGDKFRLELEYPQLNSSNEVTAERLYKELKDSYKILKKGKKERDKRTSEVRHRSLTESAKYKIRDRFDTLRGHNKPPIIYEKSKPIKGLTRYQMADQLTKISDGVRESIFEGSKESAEQKED